MKTYRIHLIRHGLTGDNLSGVYCGITDTPLCDEGKDQLRQMKEEYTCRTNTLKKLKMG